MSKHNKRGFLFDALGRMKEWRCPFCGDTFGANLQAWPKNVEGLASLRYRHLKENHEGEGLPQEDKDDGRKV